MRRQSGSEVRSRRSAIQISNLKSETPNPQSAIRNPQCLSARHVILLAAIVGGLMLAPVPDLGPVQGAAFDLMHAPICAMLAWTVFHGLRSWLPKQGILAWVFVVGMVFAAGIAIEFGQAFTGRRASLHDVAADGLGAAAAMAWAYGASPLASIRSRGCKLLAAGLLCVAAARPVMTIAHAAGSPPPSSPRRSAVWEPERLRQVTSIGVAGDFKD